MMTEYQTQYQLERNVKEPVTLIPAHLEYISEYMREFTDPRTRLVRPVATTSTVLKATDSIKEKAKVTVKSQDVEAVEITKVEPIPPATTVISPVMVTTPQEVGTMTSPKVTFKDAVISPTKTTVPITKLSNTATKDSIHTLPPPNQKLKPVMAPYGIGNTNPVIPENNLKTFNVRAPPDQIYTTTKLHNSALATLHHQEQDRLKERNPTLPDPQKVLKEYQKAKELVKDIQAIYKSEYAKQYIDWSGSFDHIKRMLIPRQKEKKESKVLQPLNREPVDYTKIQSVYQDLQHSEKRHFEMPKTFDLAMDVLERASSRQS